MSYELLCAAVIEQAVKDIEEYIVYGESVDGKAALSWVRQKPNDVFSLYASASCGEEKMRELIEAQIREMKAFKRWLKKRYITPMLHTISGGLFRNSKAVMEARREWKRDKLYLENY